MKDKFSLKEYFYGIFYNNFVRLHWRVRAEQIDIYLKKILSEKSISRVIDFGCGQGFVAAIILNYNLDYLGLDNNYKLLQKAKKRFSDSDQVVFQHGSLQELKKIIHKDDLICFSGIVHHLPDSIVCELINLSTKCGGMLILDHKMVGFTENPLAFILQKLDFGKYVRSYHYFESLDSMELKLSHTFNISFFGLTFWPLFISYYEPSEKL